MPKQLAEKMAVYRVGPQDQHLVDEHKSRWYRPTLRPGDVALSLGMGEYILLKVNDHSVTGLYETRFTAKAIGQKVDWMPANESDFFSLLAGRTVKTHGLHLALQAMERNGSLHS
jgi:hypothetical protein